MTRRSAATATTMAFNAKVRMALRDAVKEAHPEPEPGGGEMAYTAPPEEADPDAAAARRPTKFVQVLGHGQRPRRRPCCATCST